MGEQLRSSFPDKKRPVRVRTLKQMAMSYLHHSYRAMRLERLDDGLSLL